MFLLLFPENKSWWGIFRKLLVKGLPLNGKPSLDEEQIEEQAPDLFLCFRTWWCSIKIMLSNLLLQLSSISFVSNISVILASLFCHKSRSSVWKKLIVCFVLVIIIIWTWNYCNFFCFQTEINALLKCGLDEILLRAMLHGFLCLCHC